MLAANLLQWEWPPVFSPAAVLGGRFQQAFRQVVHVDEFIYRSEASAGYHVFEFANIAGPFMLLQDGLDSSRKAFNLFVIGLVIFFQEVLNEQGDIIQALGQAGHADLDGAEAIK